MSGEVKGIIKIQHEFDGGGSRAGSGRSKLTVIFLVELSAGQREGGNAPSIHHWLKEDSIKQQPKFVVEKATVLLVKEAGEKLRKGEGVYPCGILERVKGEGGKKVEKRRETDTIGERPQLVRAKSLEDQMLQQSGYGMKGKCNSHRIPLFAVHTHN